MQTREPRYDVPLLWPAYLAFYREQIVERVLSLEPDQRRVARVPSGWTPIELLSHVLHMEQRWFVWCFLGEQVEEVWGDWNSDDDPWKAGSVARWSVPDEVTAEGLADRLRAVGGRTTEVLASHPPDARAADGERLAGEPATLEWICFHVLQEYARHAGHLDIAVELAGGPTGE